MIRVLLSLTIGAFFGSLYPAIAERDAEQDIADLDQEYRRGLTDGAREATLTAQKCTWQKWLAVDK